MEPICCELVPLIQQMTTITPARITKRQTLLIGCSRLMFSVHDKSNLLRMAERAENQNPSTPIINLHNWPKILLSFWLFTGSIINMVTLLIRSWPEGTSGGVCNNMFREVTACTKSYAQRLLLKKMRCLGLLIFTFTELKSIGLFLHELLFIPTIKTIHTCTTATENRQT